MEIENDLIELVSVINKYYIDNQYVVEPRDIKFKDYKVVVLVDKDLGLSCNLLNGVTGDYLASFEITNRSNGYNLFFRFKNYAVLWDNKFGYCTELADLNQIPAFEQFSSLSIKYCDDLDSSTLFQYRLIEEKADTILLLVDELRDIISTKKYSTMYRVHLRG